MQKKRTIPVTVSNILSEGKVIKHTLDGGEFEVGPYFITPAPTSTQLETWANPDNFQQIQRETVVIIGSTGTRYFAHNSGSVVLLPKVHVYSKTRIISEPPNISQ